MLLCVSSMWGVYKHDGTAAARDPHSATLVFSHGGTQWPLEPVRAGSMHPCLHPFQLPLTQAGSELCHHHHSHIHSHGLWRLKSHGNVWEPWMLRNENILVFFVTGALWNVAFAIWCWWWFFAVKGRALVQAVAKKWWSLFREKKCYSILKLKVIIINVLRCVNIKPKYNQF